MKHLKIVHTPIYTTLIQVAQLVLKTPKAWRQHYNRHKSLNTIN